jgi:hypothetical protein
MKKEKKIVMLCYKENGTIRTYIFLLVVLEIGKPLWKIIWPYLIKLMKHLSYKKKKNGADIFNQLNGLYPEFYHHYKSVTSRAKSFR